MKTILGQKLLFRLSALFVLLVCFFLVSLGGDASSEQYPEDLLTQQPKTPPKIIAQSQPDSPISIASIQLTDQATPDSPSPEFGYYVVNASSKTIAAFAIKQDITADGVTSGAGVTLYDLLLSNSSLRAGSSRFIPETSNPGSSNNTTVKLSVDFVQFDDGKTWGADSVRSSERVLGQHAAAELLTQNLLTTLNAGKDVPRQIEDSAANLRDPQDQSDVWKAGFNAGARLLVDRLKRSNEKGGMREVQSTLLTLKETFGRKD